jgi:hypothetical protein
MSYRNSLAVMLCMVGLSACISEPPPSTEGAAGSFAENEEVAVATAALGSWSSVWKLQGFADPGHVELTTTHALVSAVDWSRSRPPGSPYFCSLIRVFDNATMSWLTVPSLPTCESIGVMWSDAGGVFVAGRYSPFRMYVLPLNNGVPGAWTLLEQAPDAIDELRTDATHVYYDDGTGIYRVARGGGPRETLATNRSMLGISDGKVYTQLKAGYTLYTMNANGSGESVLHPFTSQWRDDAMAISFDACCVYWAVQLDGTNYVRRLTKDGSSFTNFRSSTSQVYYWPQSTGSAMYLLEGASPERIRRKNLTNGNWVSESVPFHPAVTTPLVITPTRVLALTGAIGSWELFSGSR